MQRPGQSMGKGNGKLIGKARPEIGEGQPLRCMLSWKADMSLYRRPVPSPLLPLLLLLLLLLMSLLLHH